VQPTHDVLVIAVSCFSFLSLEALLVQPTHDVLVIAVSCFSFLSLGLHPLL